MEFYPELIYIIKNITHICKNSIHICYEKKYLSPFILVIFIVSIYYNNYKVLSNKQITTDLANIEALAQNTIEEDNKVNKFQYVVMDIPPQKCYVVINEQTVEGLKIVYLERTKHPVCARCNL